MDGRHGGVNRGSTEVIIAAVVIGGGLGADSWSGLRPHNNFGICNIIEVRNIVSHRMHILTQHPRQGDLQWNCSILA